MQQVDTGPRQDSNIQAVLELLRIVSQVELDCEQVRHTLVSLKGFSPVLFYERISSQNSVGVTVKDVLTFLQEYGFDVDTLDVQHVFCWYDYDSDQVLNFKEWEEFLGIKRFGLAESDTLDIDQDFIDCFSRLIDQEITASNTIRDCLDRVHKGIDYQEVIRIFKVLDSGRQGFIDLRSIYNALNTQDNFLTTHALAGRVIRRIDRNYDQRAYLDEWLHFFVVKNQPLQYSNQNSNPDLRRERVTDRKSTRLNSSHSQISYAV